MSRSELVEDSVVLNGLNGENMSFSGVGSGGGDMGSVDDLNNITHRPGGISDKFYNKTMSHEMDSTLSDWIFYNRSTDQTCNESAYNLGDSYKQVHGYIALVVCVFGVVANVLNMIVLTRKEMRTPINLMLFALALADLLIMLEYIPFAIHMYVIAMPQEERYSLNAARFVFFHTHFTQILHTISIQLTLSMAIWRYVAIKCSNRSSSFCTFKRCSQVIAAAYICPLFLCILNYLYFQIDVKTKLITSVVHPFDEIDMTQTRKYNMFLMICEFLELKGKHNCTSRKIHLYTVGVSDLVKQNEFLHKMHFWTFSVFIKLIPCIVLTFFMCWLVNVPDVKQWMSNDCDETLYKARRHHKMLERNTGYPMSTVTNHQQEGQPLTPVKSNGQTPEKDGNNLGNSLKRKSSGRHIRIADDDQNNVTGIMGTSKNGSPTGCSVVTTTLATPTKGFSPTPNDSRRESNQSGDTELKNGKRRSKGFIRFPSIRRASHSDCKLPAGKSHKTCKRTDRTTKMLIAVLLLFLLTEFPQGIMHFLSGWYGKEFFECHYNTSAEIWDMLALINSAVNFILYCFMSKQFRTQFRQIFKLHLCFKPKWMNIANCNHNATVSTTV